MLKPDVNRQGQNGETKTRQILNIEHWEIKIKTEFAWWQTERWDTGLESRDRHTHSWSSQSSLTKGGDQPPLMTLARLPYLAIFIAGSTTSCERHSPPKCASSQDKTPLPSNIWNISWLCFLTSESHAESHSQYGCRQSVHGCATPPKNVSPHNRFMTILIEVS